MLGARSYNDQTGRGELAVMHSRMEFPYASSNTRPNKRVCLNLLYMSKLFVALHVSKYSGRLFKNQF